MTRSSILCAAMLAAIVAGTGTHVPTAQETQPARPPTFRVRAEVVQLDVTVLGDGGRPVSGLTAADFTVLEDGVLQPVVAFAAVAVPTWSSDAPRWMREIAPEVATNRSDARRAVVVILDDSGIRWDPGVSRMAKGVATSTIDQLGPADLAAVVYTHNRRNGQEFTVDRAKLRAAVDRFVPSGLTAQPQKQLDSSAPTRGLVTPSLMNPTPGAGACPRGDCVLSALRNAAEILRAWPDVRKTIVLVAHRQVGQAYENFDTLSPDLRDTLTALQRANATVYEFDPRGLEVERPVTDFAQFAANATGGRAIGNTNTPGDFMPQVFRESSSYYLVGFQPTNLRHDGRFRRIQVKVARPGVTVQARSGYYAPTARAATTQKKVESATDRALSGGLPTGDLPMALTVAPFATAEGPGAALAVIASVDPRTALPAGALVELVAAAFDDTWKQVGEARERFEMPAQHPTRSSLAEMGTRLSLRPGRYEIRVALTSPSTGLAGSVYTSATIPDFARAPLSLSGVVIERKPGGAVMPEPLTALLAARPTTARVFSPSDPVSALVRVRQGGSTSLAPVAIAARVLDDHNRVAFSTGVTLEPTRFGARREADYRLDLPLDRLTDGEHLLTIEAAASGLSVRRDVRFSVRHNPRD